MSLRFGLGLVLSPGKLLFSAGAVSKLLEDQVRSADQLTEAAVVVATPLVSRTRLLTVPRLANPTLYSLTSAETLRSKTGGTIGTALFQFFVSTPGTPARSSGFIIDPPKLGGALPPNLMEMVSEVSPARALEHRKIISVA